MDTEKKVKININSTIHVEIAQSDIDRAKKSIWGMVPDEYLEKYAIDALMQTGIGNGGHPITDSDFQKAFSREIAEHNDRSQIEYAYPTYASSRLLDAVRWEFEPEQQRVIQEFADASGMGQVIPAFADQTNKPSAIDITGLMGKVRDIIKVIDEATETGDKSIEFYVEVDSFMYNMGKNILLLSEKMTQLVSCDAESADFRDVLDDLSETGEHIKKRADEIYPLLQLPEPEEGRKIFENHEKIKGLSRSVSSIMAETGELMETIREKMTNGEVSIPKNKKSEDRLIQVASDLSYVARYMGILSEGVYSASNDNVSFAGSEDEQKSTKKAKNAILYINRSNAPEQE